MEHNLRVLEVVSLGIRGPGAVCTLGQVQRQRRSHLCGLHPRRLRHGLGGTLSRSLALVGELVVDHLELALLGDQLARQGQQRRGAGQGKQPEDDVAEEPGAGHDHTSLDAAVQSQELRECRAQPVSGRESGQTERQGEPIERRRAPGEGPGEACGGVGGWRGRQESQV